MTADNEGLLGSLAGLAPVGAEGRIRAVLPPNPLDTLPTVTLPKPPLLTVDMAPEHRVLLVVRAYLGAITAAKFKTKLWLGYRIGARKPASIAKSTSYAKLSELADLFVEHKISPFAWAAWRLKVLTHDKDGKRRDDVTVPNLFALMGRSWLTAPTRRGWFRSSTASAYCSPAIEPTTVASLRVRWDSMLQAVQAARTTDEIVVRSIFEAYFPGDALSLATQRAQGELESLRLQYHKRVNEGEWLW